MAVWSPVKASFWKSPVSQRLFSRHLPEEGAWPAALTVSAPLQQRAVWSVLKGGLNSRNMKTWHLRLTPRQWWDGSLVDRARCQASLCGPWTLPLNRGQQHRWHPGETHHLLLKHRIIKVGHTGMLPSLQVCVCVCVQAWCAHLLRACVSLSLVRAAARAEPRNPPEWQRWSASAANLQPGSCSQWKLCQAETPLFCPLVQKGERKIKAACQQISADWFKTANTDGRCARFSRRQRQRSF